MALLHCYTISFLLLTVSNQSLDIMPVPLLTSTYIGAPTQALNIPALATIFTPPTFCATRWVQPDPNTPFVISGEGYLENSGVTRDYWRTCNAFTQDFNAGYSPGVCPSAMTVASIMSLVDNNYTTSKRHTEYVAQCCPRYEIVAYSILSSTRCG
jgi:hypothetical protein